MESLIGEWVGKDVSVMLRLGGGWAEDHKTSMLKGHRFRSEIPE